MSARLVLLLAALPAFACGHATLDRARAGYRDRRDASSLAALCDALREGMTRTEVEALVGEPDYSPVPGQDYYGSDDARADGVYGLVVDYRAPEAKDGALPAETLRRFQCGPIGE